MRVVHCTAAFLAVFRLCLVDVAVSVALITFNFTNSQRFKDPCHTQLTAYSPLEVGSRIGRSALAREELALLCDSALL